MSFKKPLKRILLKLSGEALSGTRKYGIDPHFTSKVALKIKEIHSKTNLNIKAIIPVNNTPVAMKL